MSVFNVRDDLLHTKTDFPRSVKEITHLWIPMRDGVRLAARIWLPEDAEINPVPALLEYIPYRKNDFTALRDSIRHPYFAGHGYASVRVDLRGSGDSEGIMLDEYLPQELDDAVEVIAWLARQAWCSGAVGMFGKSWGGFNALQVAALRPPALQAIITLCSTDDRYADDVHYLGGCLLASDMLWWACYMLGYNARPPDPKFVGDRWRELWLERLDKTPPFVEAWLAHQRRDAFWQHGSVREDYAAITCPVFAVGGWADGYTNAIPRLLAGLSAPRLGLIGPWAHEYPEVAVPGPAIGFLQECLRWWDHWLKGIDTGVMDEPMLRAWLQEGVPPQTFYDQRPGRWVAEREWPSAKIDVRRMPLTSARNGEQPTLAIDNWPLTIDNYQRPIANGAAIPIPANQLHGLYSGVFCPFGSPGDLPADQRTEDALSLTFTTPPLMERIELLGFPQATLELSSDQPTALIAVRLCSVAPDGASTLISWGMLNLTHRDSHELPTPLEPRQRTVVTVQLNAVGQAIPPGHRLRLALSSTYWPHAWPSPVPVPLQLHLGENSFLALPVRPPRLEEDSRVAFVRPEAAPLMASTLLRPESRRRTIEHDLVSGETRLIDFADDGLRRLLPDGIEFGAINDDVYTIRAGDPLSATVHCKRTIEVGRGDWQVRIETDSTMRSDAEHFYVENQVTAFEGEIQVFQRKWEKAVPRDLV